MGGSASQELTPAQRQILEDQEKVRDWTFEERCQEFVKDVNEDLEKLEATSKDDEQETFFKDLQRKAGWISVDVSGRNTARGRAGLKDFSDRFLGNERPTELFDHEIILHQVAKGKKGGACVFVFRVTIPKK